MLFNVNEGQEMYDFVCKIFPYCRSLTGEGVRQTLNDLREFITQGGGPELQVFEVPSGTKAFDWTVPREWKIREAYIEDEAGNHIIDMKDNNLHVLGYSTPVDKWVSLDELKEHIYTQPDQPDFIPYVTSYYKERFGFCMSENMKNSLPEGKYHMYIDSELFDGVLNYAEIVIPGETDEEVFFSTYFCHPSMANNECSGPALSGELVKYVMSLPQRRYTYRFVYVPETIGSITYLSQGEHLSKLQKSMVAGFNLSCVGDNRDYSIVESRHANTLADRVLKNVLHYHTDNKYSTYSFLKRGSDERQYNAPGVDLPVVGFCPSKFGEYPEYHTSADDLSLVSPEGLQGAYDVIKQVIDVLEMNQRYQVQVLCEPQLGKRGLYPTTSQKGSYDKVKAMVDFIAYADGKTDLIDISDKIGVPISELISVIKELNEAKLIKY